MTKESKKTPAESMGIVPAEALSGFEACIANAAATAEARLAPYKDTTEETVAAMPTAEVKACLADLNAASKEVNAQRLSIKRPITDALKRFDDSVKAYDEQLKAKAELFKYERDRRTEIAKADRLMMLDELYNEFAPVLYDAVPLERIMEGEKWGNPSFNEKKAEQELLDKLAKIGADYNTLKNVTLACPEETQREFFSTLDLGKALAFDSEHKAELDRIAALNAEVEANRREAEEAAAAEEAAKAEAEASYQPEPETATYIEPEPPENVIPFAVSNAEPVNVYAIALEATPTQYRHLIDFFKSEGIHGRPKITGYTEYQPLYDAIAYAIDVREVIANA